MPEELLALLERINELSTDELKKLETDLVKEFDRLDKDGHTPQNVDAMEQIRDSVAKVRAEQSGRAEAERDAQQRAEAMRSEIHAVDDEDGDKDKDGDKSGEPDTGAGQPSGQPGEAPKPTDSPSPEETARPGGPDAVAAAAAPARPPVGGARGNAPVTPTREISGLRATGKLMSVGNFGARGGLDRGQEYTTDEQLANAFTAAIETLGKGSGDPVLVASLVKEYPESRRLGRDALENEAKLKALTEPDALVATGGICGPVAVDYSIPMMAVDDEPLGNYLPDYNADRGGVRFMQPPTFASVGATGTGIWTAATDAAPGGNTKPAQAISCGAEQVVLVDAIPTRLRFGNMMARFFPEVVDVNTKLALANAARVREINRLNKISAASTVVSTGQLLGAARDLLATLDLAREAAIYRHRLPRNVTLSWVAPGFALGMLRADLIRQMAAGGDTLDVMRLSDDDVVALLRQRGIDPVFTLDGLAAGGAGNFAYPQQGFGAQGANTGLLDWPATMVHFLFPQGTFQRLDGGRLDVGVVRDSVLDSTNDYEVFVEAFEGIAFRGFESLQLVSRLRPNGASAGTVQTATSPQIY